MSLFWVQVALGSVTNVEEAVKWLSYTYLYVRMRANPLAYGINHKVYQVSDGEGFTYLIYSTYLTRPTVSYHFPLVSEIQLCCWKNEPVFL